MRLGLQIVFVRRVDSNDKVYVRSFVTSKLNRAMPIEQRTFFYLIKGPLKILILKAIFSTAITFASRSNGFRDYVKQSFLEKYPLIHTYYSIKKNSLKIAKNELAFGQLIPWTGGANSLYARQIFFGTAAYFMKVNEAGGILKKHPLRLIPVDDKNDPSLTLKISRILIKKHKIDTFFGNMGDRNILTILPDIKRQAILALFPFAFNKILKSPFLTYIFNGTNDKELQIEKIVNFLVCEQKLKNIAIFHQNDELGIYLGKYTALCLHRAQVEPIAITPYHLKHMEITKAAQTLKALGPDAIISLADYMPSCRLISQFFRTNNTSNQSENNHPNSSTGHNSPETLFIGTDDMYFAAKILEDCLGNYCSNIYFTSFLPLPDKAKTNYKVVQEYLCDLVKYFPKEEPSPLGLSYYINAKLTVEILAAQIAKSNIPVTQNNLKSILQQGLSNIDYYDLGGFIAFNTKGCRSAVYPLDPHIFNLRKRNRKNRAQRRGQ